MNVFLEKIAADGEKPKTRSIAEGVVAYKGVNAVREVPEKLLGYHTLYHGTTKENAASIKKHGFDPSKGGSHNAKLLDSYVKNSIGHNHFSKSKLTGRFYASNPGKHLQPGAGDGGARQFLKEYMTRKGEVLKTRVPNHMYVKGFIPDMDSNHPAWTEYRSQDQLKSHASKTSRHIPSKYVSGGVGDKGVSQFLNKKNLSRYLSSPSGQMRAVGGLKQLALGSAMIGGAAYSNAKSGGILSKLNLENKNSR